MALAIAVLLPAGADAKPQAPELFCDYYSDTPECSATLITCDTCHVSTDPPSWNAFGTSLASQTAGRDFDSALFGALQAVEQEDADGDGISNLEEIVLGTNPGDERSLWIEPVAPEQGNPRWALGEYDVEFAMRRVTALYCGQSPTYEQLQGLRKLDDLAAQRAELHRALDECLASDWWTSVGVSELADPKIRPVRAVGIDTEVYFGNIRLVLGDYFWDYRLWRWVMTGDRDMRDLLTAQYHVEEDADGNLAVVEGDNIETPAGLVAGGQPLDSEYRAGMLTTQWFLMANTMFSALPRTTAAQAYRAYLGADLSKQQGIRPVEGEPLDVDDKGVAEATCAGCHSTLDPLSYAFAYYTGIQFPSIGVYSETRPASMIEGWDELDYKSEVLGQPVESLVEWAAVAAESDEFKRAMTATLWAHAFGREPQPDEAIAFEEAWMALPDDGYSANALIHRIVDSHTFGAP